MKPKRIGFGTCCEIVVTNTKNLGCQQFDVSADGFLVRDGDLLGVSSENSAWNLVSVDEDHTQRVLLRRRRRLANSWSLVFADLPNVDDVLDDFTHDAATSRFSVAAQIKSCKISTMLEMFFVIT